MLYIDRVMAVKHRAPKTASLSAAALRAFFAIAQHWDLDAQARRTLLGGVPESTFYKYAADPQSAHLSRDTLERISHIIGIFKSINVLLPRPEQADTWIKRPNETALFKGRSALDYMLSGRFEDLIAVRRYLDTARGW